MDGSSRSGFSIPAPHCCNFYSKINFGGEMKTMCYHKDKTGSGKPKMKKDFGMPINSIDCGSSTYTVLGETTPWIQVNMSAEQKQNQMLFLGTVGRVTLPGLSNSVWPFSRTRVRVGEYDLKKMPAIMLFPDLECKSIPKRYYFDPEDGDASFYNYEDMLRQ